MSVKTIRNVTVLGAGVLGGLIAYQAAFAGFRVVSFDINDDALKAAKQRFEKLADLYANKIPEATTEKLALTRECLQQSSDLKTAVMDADLIIEAVPENLKLKKQIWEEVGKHAPSHTIFTTNTSTILPSLFANSSGDSSRFLALHFANDIWKVRIVEVMGTEQTNKEYIDATFNFAKAMGMAPVVIKKEQPGYIMNSLLVPLLDAACRLYVNEVAEPADVDKVWKMATGSPRGPFEIIDLIGLRTMHTGYSVRADKLGDKDFQKLVDILKTEFLDKGKTGIESGSGFYDYNDHGKVVKLK